MADREKVYKGLECCKRKDGNECKVCPYTESEYCTEDMVTDALALLKEQQEQVDRLIEENASNAEMAEGLKELLKEQEHKDKMYHALEDDWKRLKELLKEQEAVEWINVKDRLPKKDGQYLVVYTFFDYKGMGVVRFSQNLHGVDEYIFNEENRPGWYEPDDEVGYFERTTVTHWAKLPEFPKEGRRSWNE